MYEIIAIGMTYHQYVENTPCQKDTKQDAMRHYNMLQRIEGIGKVVIRHEGKVIETYKRAGFASRPSDAI